MPLKGGTKGGSDGSTLAGLGSSVAGRLGVEGRVGALENGELGRVAPLVSAPNVDDNNGGRPVGRAGGRTDDGSDGRIEPVTTGRDGVEGVCGNGGRVIGSSTPRGFTV